MKISKILSLLFFSIIFYSINLNSMGRKKLSDEEFFAEKQKGFDLRNQIEKYEVDHKQEVQELKQQINNAAPDKLFALCLMLEEEIRQGKMENLQILIKTPELFIDFINTNRLKQLMYLLLNDASYNNQNTCIDYICQKYLDLFENSIFSREAEDNDNLLILLFQNDKLDSIKILINKQILDWVKNKSELRTLAKEKKLNDMADFLAQEIRKDRIETCLEVLVIASCLSSLFIPYFFS